MTRAATPAKTPPRDLRVFLESARDRLAEALPRHLGPERLIQLVSAMAFENPKLAECDQGSVLASLLKAASLGLDLTTGMMEGYLIPRWNKHAGRHVCTFMVGYQGLVKLARQAGCRGIRSAVVYQNDTFTYRYDPELVLQHIPATGPRGGIVGVYATGQTPDGTHIVEYLSAEEVEAVRARSQSPDEGPWRTDWAEMARKTALKRLCKALPRSVELQSAIAWDNQEYQPPAAALTPPPASSRSAALGARLAPTPALEAPAEDTPQAEIVPAEYATQDPGYDDSIHDTEGGRNG
jgi:recombination protein RecT